MTRKADKVLSVPIVGQLIPYFGATAESVPALARTLKGLAGGQDDRGASIGQFSLCYLNRVIYCYRLFLHWLLILYGTSLN